ncbi:hypothetical protein OS493_029470 [Desmophyllum pertusum]|uniref:Uncharacterized protein n=1 Tax=Desmophyllum pertusum TaxID=174260 RepID=A0A9W9Y8U4_9CNID|nr:hypothetical protein OS493_029470 [Desmophyllum pertusum]
MFMFSSTKEFQCLVCRGRGDNPQDACDKNGKLETCTPPAGKKAICDATLYSFGTFVRLCSDMVSYEASVITAKPMEIVKRQCALRLSARLRSRLLHRHQLLETPLPTPAAKWSLKTEKPAKLQPFSVCFLCDNIAYTSEFGVNKESKYCKCLGSVQL